MVLVEQNLDRAREQPASAAYVDQHSFVKICCEIGLLQTFCEHDAAVRAWLVTYMSFILYCGLQVLAVRHLERLQCGSIRTGAGHFVPLRSFPASRNIWCAISSAYVMQERTFLSTQSTVFRIKQLSCLA